MRDTKAIMGEIAKNTPMPSRKYSFMQLKTNFVDKSEKCKTDSVKNVIVKSNK